MDMQVWFDFLKQNWLVILIALVVLFVVINVVKTMAKWALVILIVVGLIVYSGKSLDQISSVVKTVKDETVDTVKTEAMKVMIKEAKDAKYTSSGDGNYTITSPNLEMKGQAGKEKVDVTFRGVPLGQWKINDTVHSFIAESKNNSSVTSGK
ncbi:hypothetical protein [Paenibacillus pini]|uniref:Uncharacterized protein n=1 Tax=Paenibacillus pini JCM 16418 TaxID=1236976 RepID=W7YHS3_9BACL|nr:hypothetical protein [Paenibacillus pini]GAF08012.1 hypothetical protein JCM16418_2048 [Paenibacillus pini JCM 16418]